LRGIGHHPLKAIRIIWWYLKFGTKIFKDNPYVEVILIALQKFAGTYHQHPYWSGYPYIQDPYREVLLYTYMKTLYLAVAPLPY
jgi:hypothetical protein